MNVQRLFFFLAIFYLAGFLLHALYLKKTVYGDGIFYYSWLRSVVVDGDIDFHNDYTHFGVTQPLSPSGQLGNKYSVGPGILWAPAFLWIHSITRGDGFTFPYQLATGFWSVLVALTGLILLYRLLARFFSNVVVTVTLLLIAFASNLFFYGSLDVVNSHAASFLAVTLFLSLLYTNKRNRSWFFIGVSLGFVGLMRTQDLLYGVLLIPSLFVILAIRQLAERIRLLSLFGIGFILGFLPELAAWQALYGTFWMSPYLTHEGFNPGNTHILDVLFSPSNGLILWTPITLLGFLGLFLRTKTSRLPLRLFALVIILQTLVVASWSSWNQGASYSGRMFVSALPFFAIGLSQLYKILIKFRFRLTHFTLIFVIPLSVVNMMLMFFFLLRN